MKGEPIAYILQKQAFWSLTLTVSPATLIPRSETELLVEKALTIIPANQPYLIADLGTGSGAIAIAIAAERPLCRIIATDISIAALQIAQHNAHYYQLQYNITFIAGYWFAAFFPQQQFDMIISNPPYIAKQDPHLQQLSYEPPSALIADQQGLKDIQHLIIHSKKYLKQGAYLLLEHGYDQSQTVQQYLSEEAYLNIQSDKDLNGQYRISIATT